MGEECLNASKRRKIEDTVLQILKASDMETITEFSVRSAAAVRLGFELSGLNHRLLVRQIVDSFLLSTAAEILRTDSLNRINDANSTDKSVDCHVEQRRQQQQRRDIGSVSEANYDGKIVCKLSNKRRVTIHEFLGTTMVSIREFYVQDGNLLPVKGTNSGISLTSAQWTSFRKSIPSIEEAIVTLESRLRSGAVTMQSESGVASSMADSASEKIQTETGVSNMASVIHPSCKRKQNQSEPDMRSSAADPAAEKSQTQATISNLVSIVHSHIKSEQPEADTSNAETASISQEHILAEKAQEAPGTYGTTATSSYQEQIPSTLVPPPPNQLDRVATLSPGEQIPAHSKQTDKGISTSVPSFPSQGHSYHTAHAIPPEQLTPIQPARFDGRNYYSWRNKMEMFLNQLNIAYVLSERCPIISLNREASFEAKVGAETAVQRWIADDYLCRHNILNSLCDSLFQLYSQKSFSAGELWEELKEVYSDDFGTKRSQINKYIHFQMVDGVSILDQVQELHVLADSIIASGTWIEETFHVSVIISKLPPSWKELRLKLMQEEFVPLNMLMHRLRVEAESRELYKKDANSKKDHVAEAKLDQRQRLKKDEYKRACFTCGKEGHIRKNCRDRKFEHCDTSNGKESGSKMDDADKKQCFTCGKDGHISKSCPDRKFEPCDKSNGKENEVLSPIAHSGMDDAAKPK
ncbi:hypothetical protein C2S52_011226 [Perilla frutescens var. hirtella]|nr:hypothetical protein C2S52_011226 [Perilla frutescens var. hirtella]